MEREGGREKRGRSDREDGGEEKSGWGEGMYV